MSLSLVHHSSEFTELSLDAIGGKAVHLARLAKSGFPVPRFYVISADAFRQAVNLDRWAGFQQDNQTVAGQIRAHIDAISIPMNIRDQIESAHAGCFPTDPLVAVRSSAISEDGAAYSFAGMYESVLGVRRQEDLLSAVKQVWRSAVSPRVIAYRGQHGLSLVDLGIAVIIQELVDAEASGVCFTCDPLSQSNGQILINSLYGLGEGMVSRGLPADSYRIARESLEIDADLVEKSERLEFDQRSESLCCVDVPVNDRRLGSLSEAQVVQVATAAVDIESEFGAPQDIEFCFDQDQRLSILQARPITGRVDSDTKKPEPGAGANHIVWDNSNIIESYWGVTTPMTFSFIRRAYSIVYHCFAEVMGISPRVVHQNQSTFNNMLGLFDGRVYYNLNNWYRLVRLFPGYHYNRRFMESMMGVKESAALEDPQEPVGRWQRWLVEFPSLMKLVARSGWNFMRIRKLVQKFELQFYRDYDQWSQIEFSRMPPHEIARLYDMMERRMLWNWKAPIINDFFVMVFFGILRKMCSSWCSDETGSLQNGLVCGEGGLQSDQPAKLLMRMAQLIKNNTKLKSLVLGQPLKSLPDLIAGDDHFETFNRLMKEYLDEFGLRCANELKLESYSYRDHPEQLYALLRSYLASNQPSTCDVDAMERRERETRQQAEQQASEQLAQSSSWMPRRMLFAWVLKNARLGVKNRENMRFARTRIYGILRCMLRAIGQQFADQGILDDREDIFYLTIDEVWSYIHGTSVTSDLAGLAKLRKAQYQTYRDQSSPPPPDRFETYDLPYHGIAFPVDVSAGQQRATLSGIGCCPGVVRGRVQVISDPLSDPELQGDILVAQRTDPGWVALYPAFSGVLVERGSLLSHSAIVAREMGIPTIVAITGLTQQVRNGQRVVMDGRTGQVQIESEP